jgi:Uri superfamily endonuclease
MARSSARPRTYQLAIETKRAMRIRVGRLGEFLFPAGLYVYTGSARRGLAARIGRHLSGAKCLHWHIDYLLATPGARIAGVSVFGEPECAVNRRTPGAIVVRGFGSSDCTSGCGSHLKLVARPAARRRAGKTRRT